MIRILVHALRVGASVDNPTPYRRLQFVIALAVFALELAKQRGYLAGVPEADVIELILIGAVMYAQLISDETVGVWPRAHRDPRIDERLRDQSVPTDGDAPEARNPKTGFPKGHFFDS
jgi:hypothetical protein